MSDYRANRQTYTGDVDMGTNLGIPVTPAKLENTADPSDESTWHKPCWNCGHTPGCAWVEDCGYAACPECFAD